MTNIHIITPCLRPNNLNLIRHSIPKECNWIVVYDPKAQDTFEFEGATFLYSNKGGCVGHPCRNFVLDNYKFGKDDWIYMLDDDNIIHEDWYENILPFINSPAGMITWAQDNYGPSGRRLEATRSPRILNIDTASYMYRYEVLGDLRYQEHYAGDGILAERLTEKTEVLTINKDLCYYNSFTMVEDNRKDFAVFTIAKNEDFFIPRYINHYSRFVDKEDIYILDHDSDDGSTEGLDVNVIKVSNEVAFDHKWLKKTVQEFQVKLLQKYKVVVFAEIDELLCSEDGDFRGYLNRFLASESRAVKAQGRTILHDFDNEKSLISEELIMNQRKYWHDDPFMRKSLISKIPLIWTEGFHNTKNVSAEDSKELLLIHLHFCDLETNTRRTLHRIKNAKKIEKGSNGSHNKKTNPTEIEGEFKRRVSNCLKGAQPIPDHIKNNINWI